MTLKEVLDIYDLKVDDEPLRKLDKYAAFLENSKVNLTALRGEEIYHKMIADVLVPLKDFPILSKFIDVGTGGGNPGLVISVYYGVKGVLLDATKKKLEVLKEFVDKEEIEVELLWGRAEELAHDKGLRGSFEYVFSKALARLNIALELTSPFAMVGGYVLVYKGANWKEELEESWGAMEKLGLDLGDVIEYKLKNGENRALMIFEKIKSTPSRYPRKFSRIKKSPLR